MTRGILVVALVTAVMACSSARVDRKRMTTERWTTSPLAGELQQASRSTSRPRALGANALNHLLGAAQASARSSSCDYASNLAGPASPPHQRRADAARDYYRIMYGPFDRLRDFEPFLNVGPRPAGAGFYPEDITALELESWLGQHPEDRESFMSLFTVIRRQGDRLVAIPYRQEYRELLTRAAGKLKPLTRRRRTTWRFLTLRARAFLSDDYYESDLAWMDLDSPIEVVIGPYETYEDTLFGYKASYEAFICVVQPADAEQLDAYKRELPFLERNLPIAEEHKTLDRGAESPIRVADELFTAGDCRAGVQTLAFNLPNDERVRQAKGSKKVMLKNMMEAKYEAIL
jgi:hypothetical protein